MRSRVGLLYVALAAAVAIWLVSGLSGDRRRIERQLDRLRDLVEKSDGESALTGANNARLVGNLMTREFELLLEPYGSVVGDRARLSQLVLQYRNAASRIGLGFRNESFDVDSDLGRAEMVVLATVTGSLDGSGYRERYRLGIGWREEDGEWRIERVELIEVLEGPQGFF